MDFTNHQKEGDVVPRYAMIKPPFDGWEAVLPNAEEEFFEGERVLALDSLTFTEQERRALKKQKIPVRCPLCQGEVYFKHGFKRRGEDVAPHWVHKDTVGLDCYIFESLAHAQTKWFLFGKLAERGYKVREEKKHKVGDRTVRADVAVLERRREGDVLKLVVEVQASPMRVGEAKKRMAVYYEEATPVAWVLLLDSLFEDYAIEGAGEELEPDREYVFAVAGKEVPLFDFLMDTYQYTVAVRRNGNVLLIRRDPTAARLRAEALERGEKWDSTNDVFWASLIHDRVVADVLIQTPLIAVDYVPNERKPKVEKDLFFGKDCDYIPPETERQETFIDFERGRTTGNTLDTLALIRQTWEEARRGREEARKKIEERKKREEERRRREKEREMIEMEDVGIRFDDGKPIEIIDGEIRFDDHEPISEREEESRQPERSFEAERWSWLINEPLHPFWEEERRKIREEGLRRKAERERIEEWKRDTQVWGRALLEEEATDERSLLIREFVWREYENMPKNKRAEWERETFQNRLLPIWFAQRKMKLERKEHEEMKKWMRKLRKQEKKQEERKSDNEQLSLFFD